MRKRSSTIAETLTSKSSSKSKSKSSLSLSSKTPKPKKVKKKINKIGFRGRSQSQTETLFKRTNVKSSITATDNLSKVNEKHCNNLSNRFNNDQLCDIINKFDVKYNEINQITDLTLKILGIDDELQRKTILNEIEHLQSLHKQDINKLNITSQKTKMQKQYGIFYYCYYINVCKS